MRLLSKNASLAEPGFRLDLQGLRAIAVLLVVLSHAGVSTFAGGFIGVDVFFVLSGFLITGLLLHEYEETKRIALATFYARRLKRLLPALALMISVVFVLALFLLSHAEARAQLASAPFAATWTSNLFFSFRSVDYFDEIATHDLYTHTWSLGVEEQFYLVWPVLLLAIFRMTGFLSADGERGRRRLLSALVIAMLASLALSLYWTSALPQSAFYQMPSRLWQLALGGIVRCLGEARKRDSRPEDRILRWSQVALSVGLVLILGCAVCLSRNMAYPGFWALLPSLGAALTIAGGTILAHPSASFRSPLAHPALVWLGDRSYSLYLWHWPILVLGFALGYRGELWPTVCLILFSLLAAIVSYRLVELPFWKGIASHAQPRMILLTGMLVMIVLVFGLTAGLSHLPRPEPKSDRSLKWRFDIPEIYYRMQCDDWYSNDRLLPCVFGPKGARKTVVVVGDSVLAQWFSAFPAIYRAPEWRVVVLTKSSCPMVDEDFFYERIGAIYHVCTRWRDAVLDELDRSKPDVVITGSAATYGFSEKSWVEGSSRIFARLARSARKVYVVPGTPTLGFDGPSCVDRNLSRDGKIDPTRCVAENRQSRVAPVRKYLERAVQGLPNVGIVDLNDLVCPDGACRAISLEGQVVFRDSQHLTDSFVRSKVPEIEQRFAGPQDPKHAR